MNVVRCNKLIEMSQSQLSFTVIHESIDPIDWDRFYRFTILNEGFSTVLEGIGTQQMQKPRQKRAQGEQNIGYSFLPLPPVLLLFARRILGLVFSMIEALSDAA